MVELILRFSQRHFAIAFRKYLILPKMTLNIYELFPVCLLTRISFDTKIERLILEV